MKLFVWDFHGVLEQGNELAVLVISNLALEKAGFTERFTHEDIHNYYGLKWFEYFERLIPNLDIEVCKKLQDSCLHIQGSDPSIVAENIYVTPGAFEVLESIVRAGHKNLLISNTQPDALKFFVTHLGYDKYFKAENTIAADAHRVGLVKKIKDLFNSYVIKKDFEAYISIGDSKDDLTAIEDKGGITYLYAHSHRAFKDVDADYKINDLREVLREV